MVSLHTQSSWTPRACLVGGLAWSVAGAARVRHDQGYIVQCGFTSGLVHGPLGHHVWQGLMAYNTGVGLPGVPFLLCHSQDAVGEVEVWGPGLRHWGTGHILV